MTTRYAVALPITITMQQQLEQLHKDALEQRASVSDDAGKLMTDITCHVIDYIFTNMIQQFASVDGISSDKRASFEESLGRIKEIKKIIHKYFGWAVSWFDAKRLAPVIGHYNQMVNQCALDSESTLCIIYDLPDDLAKKSLASLSDLNSLNASNALHAIECLIEVIDVGVTKLLKEPKELLKFNFVVNKTLDGVITMTTALSYKSLRKLGNAMDSQLHQSASDHLQQFIIPVAVSVFNQHEAVDTDLG